jgi:ubiquinone/menaquinone biosynthesis C-methylase UbiE
MVFDPLAEGYDSAFTRAPVARWLRGRVHARLDALLRPGDHVLELGCGTGEDAGYVATRGVYVTATDASPAMLRVAESKFAQHHKAVAPHISFHALDLNALPDADFDGPYDAVLANFGVLNCVADRAALAAWLEARVKPGGTLAFGVMSPTCAWEIGWNLAHLRPRAALRRARPARFATETGALTVTYPSPRALVGEFGAVWRMTRLLPLGLFLPPSELFGVVEAHPALLERLKRWEARAVDSRWASSLARLADHYWIEFVRGNDL